MELERGNMLKRALLVLVLAAGADAPPLTAQTSMAPRTHRIEIQSFAFVPARIEVRAGDTVEWINRDLAPHTATADGGEWDTDLLKHGATGRYVASTAGTLAYHCRYHPQMKGNVVVTTAASSSERSSTAQAGPAPAGKGSAGDAAVHRHSF